MPLNGTLTLHDIHDVEKFNRRILDTYLRRTRATLNPDDTEDILAYLVATCWELSTRYEPTRSSSFSKYAYNILTLRIVTWYRNRWHDGRYISAQERADIGPTLSLDTITEDADNEEQHHQYPAAPEHQQDTLDLALRASRGDPTADCDPDLARLLRRTDQQNTRDHHILRQAATRRAA